MSQLIKDEGYKYTLNHGLLKLGFIIDTYFQKSNQFIPKTPESETYLPDIEQSLA